MRISILVSLVLSCIWALMGHTLFSWLTDNPEIIRLGTIILFIDVIWKWDGLLIFMRRMLYVQRVM